MRRVWTNHGLRLLAFSAVLALMSLMALCLVLLIRTNQTQEFKAQASQNCRQINLLKGALRAVLLESETTALAREGLTADQVVTITDYFERQRARFANDKCPSEGG